MKLQSALVLLGISYSAAFAGNFAIFQVSGSTPPSPLGINVQPLKTGGDAQAPLNALNSAWFWQTSTTTTGGGDTGEGANLNVDPNGFPISFVGKNGSNLTATNLLIFVYGSQGIGLYPTGNASWDLIWDGGAATWAVSSGYDNTALHSGVCGANCLTVDVTASSQGMGFSLQATGASTSSSASFSGTTVSWTGSNFPAGTPVACQNGGGTLPAQVTANATLYVVSPSTNSFSLATTISGSPISFTGGSGSNTCWGNWARNFRLLQPANVALWNSGELWNPTYVAFMKHFRTIRFLQMLNTYGADNNGNPAVVAAGMLPTPKGYLMWGGVNEGSGTFSGIPIEAAAALANEINGSMYINIPPMADAAWNTAAATSALNTLNAPHKVYLEHSNEIWSFANFLNGPTSPPNMGSVGLAQFPSCGLATSANCKYLGYVYQATQNMAVWTTVWGSQASTRLVRILAGQQSNDCYSEYLADMAALIGGGSSPTTVTISIANPAVITQTAHGYLAGQPIALTTTGALPTGLTATTWATTGCQSTGSITTYYVSTTGLTANAYQLADTKAHALAGTNSIVTTGSQSGTQTSYGLYWPGTASSNFDVGAIAGYWTGGERLPSAWSADVDAGRTKFQTEYLTGGLLPNIGSTSHTTGGTSTAYTVTSGQGLSCPPPNGAIIYVKFNQANGASAGLAADGCGTSTPLQDVHGNAEPAGAITTNLTYPIVYTSTICQTFSATGCSATTSTTAGWRAQDLGIVGGFLQEGLGWNASAVAAFTARGLPLINYEWGQNFSDFGQGDVTQQGMYNVLNASSEMGTVYTSWMSQYAATGVTLGNHYADFTTPSDFGYWGLQQYLTQSNQPKTTAVLNFIATTPCWWSGCTTNFLLNRDLNPVSNDNSPVGLDKVA